MNKVQNQIHPPLPKKKRVDAIGNEKRRLWLKDGTTTMLLCNELTANGYKAFINTMNSTLIKLGAKPFPKNKFLITQ